jgi:hypothetical protein
VIAVATVQTEMRRTCQLMQHSGRLFFCIWQSSTGLPWCMASYMQLVQALHAIMVAEEAPATRDTRLL